MISTQIPKRLENRDVGRNFMQQAMHYHSQMADKNDEVDTGAALRHALISFAFEVEIRRREEDE